MSVLANNSIGKRVKVAVNNGDVSYCGVLIQLDINCDQAVIVEKESGSFKKARIRDLYYADSFEDADEMVDTMNKGEF